MLEFIEGEIVDLDLNHCVLGVNGLGYSVSISTNTYKELVDVKYVKLKIFMNVKEDGITLYGFYSDDERELFNLLTSVTGIGPKAGMSILSEFNVSEFCRHIEREDVKSLQKPVGIGRKSAERILLELKDKIKKISWTTKIYDDIKVEREELPQDILQEVQDGLISLGYSEKEANLAINSLDGGMEVEELLKAALKILSKNK